jgi:hypothetical protein
MSGTEDTVASNAKTGTSSGPLKRFDAGLLNIG